MKIVLERLAQEISEKCTSFKKVLVEWPDPKIQLDLPCCSIIPAGPQEYVQIMPEFLKREEGVSLYTVGNIEMKLQLDLWSSYSEERDLLLAEVLDLFNQQLPTGLRLSMPGYYDTIASYNHTGYTILDNEDSSIVSERRVKIDILVNFDRVSRIEESTMEEISLKEEIDEGIIETTII